MTQMSKLPAWLEANAIRAPSGDQAGLPLSPGPVGSWRGFFPSASMIQTPQRPDRFDSNAIWRPSNDNLVTGAAGAHRKRLGSIGAWGDLGGGQVRGHGDDAGGLTW